MFRLAVRCKAVLRSARSTSQRRMVIDLSYSNHFMDYNRSSIPIHMKKMLVTKLTPNFREAVSVHTVPVPSINNPGDLLVRNRFVGINASDINYSAGRYDLSATLPYPVGFEAVGEVVALGLSASSSFTVGDAVAYVSEGAFAEYTVVPMKKAVSLPAAEPEALAVLVSGATAFVSLQRLAELKNGETVLVTAAAGGTGQYAVQLAKRAGCHVVGTCSSKKKVEFLRNIGCDRPVNYKEEDLATVLQKEYPKGLNVVYESVGGSIFDLVLNNLAQHGRLLVIGFISGYQNDSGLPPIRAATLPAKLLKKSASMRGFFLPHFSSEYSECVHSLLQMQRERELMCFMDDGQGEEGGRFEGLESVYRAIDYMYSGKNIGKVVVELKNPICFKF